MDLLSKNEANRNIVRNITISTIEKIKLLVTPHLHGSGFVKHDNKGNRDGYIMLVTFGDDDEGDSISYECGTDENLTCEGFTEDGMITDSFMCIAVLDYDEMSFDQAAFALDIAIDQFGEK